MKRLIVCADGTWNSRDDASESGDGLTNVARLDRLIAATDVTGTAQIHEYFAGVGVGGPSWKHWLGGTAGYGLSENVMDGYGWLVQRYAPGDQVFLFGFSRGAYTARSLAGLIRNSGLLRREHAARIQEAYDLYRDRAPGAHPKAQRSIDFRAAYSHEPRIHFLGVWDTVGSLGVPTSGPLGWYTRHRYGFHDVTLSSWIVNAFHALAIDERRKPFAPTLWEAADPERSRQAGQRVEQAWFAGSHCDVGGGHAECGLSDIPLGWMLAKAQECGLAFARDAGARMRADCHGQLHDSMTSFYRAFGEHLRPIREARRTADGTPIETFESVNSSALDRHRQGSNRYDPPNLSAYLRQFGSGATPAESVARAPRDVPVPPSA